MNLATKLLEGYSVNGNGGTFGLTNVCDPVLYLQEACTEFITESSALIQQYYTADIIGQAQAITEGAEPLALLEANTQNLWKKFVSMIKTLIGKFKDWAKSVREWFSKKVKKYTGDDKSLERSLKDMDDKEPIRDSAGNEISMLLSTYDLDAGDNLSNKVFNATKSEVDIITDSKFISEQARKGSNDDPCSLVDDIVRDIEDNIGFTIDQISDKIRNAYMPPGKQANTVITAGLLRSMIEDKDICAKAIVVATENGEKIVEQFNHIQKIADGNSEIDQTKIPEIITSVQRLVSIAQTVVNATKEAYQNYFDQIVSVTGLVKSKCGAAVKEGTEVDDPDTVGDPPSEDDEEDGIVEGAAYRQSTVDDTCDTVTEGIIQNIKDNKQLRKDAKAILNDVGSSVNFKEEAKLFKEAQKAFHKKNYDEAIKKYNEYIKSMTALKKKVGSAKGDYNSSAKTALQSSCDVEISLTKTFLEKAKTKKAQASGVSESTSIWDQAAQYM